jgi:polygalacturonase
VVLPADPRTGTAAYATGPIRLASRIELHVPAGVSVLFSTDPADYPLVYTRWQGIECYNYSPNIYAFEATDIAVTGDGVLDAQASASNWWAWKSRETNGWNVLQGYANDGFRSSSGSWATATTCRPAWSSPTDANGCCCRA